jgi:hypothetical protein
VSDELEGVEVECRFMDAGDVARNAMKLVEHEEDARRLWNSMTPAEQLDLVNVLRSQLIRLLERPDQWVPAVSAVRGERLDITISIPLQAFESRPLGDRLVTMERVRDDLVRVLAELRDGSQEEDNGVDG